MKFVHDKYNFCNYRHLLSLLFVLIIGQAEINAQGIHYSQFFSSPMVLNPAYTGQHDGKFRLVSNTRLQGMAYNSNELSGTIGYDQAFAIKKSNIGLGLMYTFDRTMSSSYPSQMLDLSIASAVKISNRSGLSLGIQLGYRNNFLTLSHLTFPEQYDRNTGHYNEQLPVSEDFDQMSNHYFNVNAGLVWNYKVANSEWSTGLSVRHINGPEVSFLGEENSVKLRFIYHLSYKNKSIEKVSLTPQLFVSQQNKMSYVSTGANVQLNEVMGLQKCGFILGSYYVFREEINNSSIVTLLGLKKGMLTGIVSFDFNLNSQLGNVHQQAVEITLLIKRPSLTLKNTTTPWLSY